MVEAMITYRGTVYPWQCDHMGHMNVMWYVGKFDEATWQFFTSMGASAKRLRDEHMGMVAVEQHLEYKRELLAGDVVTIRSFVREVREKVVIFVHEMTGENPDELVARSVLTGVCIDTTTRKSRPMPPDIRERIASSRSAPGGE